MTKIKHPLNPTAHEPLQTQNPYKPNITPSPSLSPQSRAISRRGGSRINYQEAEDEATDEDDLMEVDAAQAAAAAEQDAGETVERVLNDRVGKVGG